MEDLFSDVNFQTTRVMGGKIHQGFYQRSQQYDGLLGKIKPNLEEGERVVLTGHPLGGAVAQAMALRLLLNDDTNLDAKFYQQILCVSFAAPLVGDKEIANAVDANFRKHFFNYVHETDMVPRAFLLHKAVIQQLHSNLGKTGIFEKGEEKIKLLLVPVLAACISFFNPAAAPLALPAYEALKGGMKEGMKWYADEKAPDFVPFGAYLFCEKDQDHPVTIVNHPKMIVEWLKHMKFPDVKSVMNHQLSGYSGFLERLRIPIVAEKERAIRKDEL